VPRHHSCGQFSTLVVPRLQIGHHACKKLSTLVVHRLQIIRGFVDSWLRGFAASRLRGFAASRLRGFAASRLPASPLMVCNLGSTHVKNSLHPSQLCRNNTQRHNCNAKNIEKKLKMSRPPIYTFLHGPQQSWEPYVIKEA
jgi:hypothetical protein